MAKLQEHCQCEVLRQAADAAAAWNASPWLNRLRSRARATVLRQLLRVNERGTVHTWLLVGSGTVVVARGGCSSWLHSHHSGTVSC